MIEVRIVDISLSNLGFVVLLQSIKHEKTLPIFIGMPEAQAIAIQYENIETPRPLTHDLLKNILTLLNSKIDKVVIDDYKEHTYYAKIFFETEDNKFQVDARPSDAIALALKYKVSIYVNNYIMDNYSIKLKDEINKNKKIKSTEKTNGKVNEKYNNDETLGRKTEIDMLQDKLKQAVEEERYEDAAFIRDELKKYKGKE